MLSTILFLHVLKRCCWRHKREQHKAWESKQEKWRNNNNNKDFIYTLDYTIHIKLKKEKF